MATCFVIQPFDNGKYDKRFSDVYAPAIVSAELEPYRVDKDSSVSVPIESIEDGIRASIICLADITEDNPNVWYELGFAFAMGREVVMVCAEDRTGKKYPFDIQHRSVISYKADSPSDFESLKQNITAALKAKVSKGVILQQMADSDPVGSVKGLTQKEIIVLVTLATESFMPESFVSAWSAKRDAEKTGLNSLGFNLAIRQLIAKEYILKDVQYDERVQEPYDALQITEIGWSWIEANESLLNIHHPPIQAPVNILLDEDIPF